MFSRQTGARDIPVYELQGVVRFSSSLRGFLTYISFDFEKCLQIQGGGGMERVKMPSQVPRGIAVNVFSCHIGRCWHAAGNTSTNSTHFNRCSDNTSMLEVLCSALKPTQRYSDDDHRLRSCELDSLFYTYFQLPQDYRTAMTQSSKKCF